ncbi:hypothetical protein [Vibrio sp.]|uniref:hypothetical protein n=1 Tax=Vibrio sp. TaxID=678 RepID=UPI003AA86236
MKGIITPDASYWKSVALMLILTTLGCSTSPSQPSDTQTTPAPQSLPPQSNVMKSASLISPEVEAMQIVQRHCQLLDSTVDLPIYCHLNTQSDSYQLDLSFNYYESSQRYLILLSHGLISPYCQAVNLHEVEGSVMITIFATQIQRQYDCRNKHWQDWQPISKPTHSPFVVFLNQCRTWDEEHPDAFHCNVDWYEYVPILVFTFDDMQSVSELSTGQPNTFIQSFCQSGLKEFGDALYLLEVPSFNLAKMKHCGSETETEWFAIDSETGPTSANNVI